MHLPVDRETGRPRGFAFVEFQTDREASEAIERFHNKEVSGRRLNVNAAEDRPRRSEGFRPGGGRPSPAHPPRDFAFDSDPFGSDRSSRPFKNKGSRRGMRARKRSLNF